MPESQLRTEYMNPTEVAVRLSVMPSGGRQRDAAPNHVTSSAPATASRALSPLRPAT